MPSSKVDIANMVLEKLGQTVTITALSENTKHAKAINRAWDRVRDFVFADHPWLFATKVQAAAVSPDPVAAGWTYLYAYPADCVNFIAITGADGVRAIRRVPSMDDYSNHNPPIRDGRTDFEVLWAPQGTAIASDVEGAWIRYVAAIEDTARWTPKFIEAFANRMAWDRAGAIAGELGLQMRGALMQDYLYAKYDAGVQDGNEQRDNDTEVMTPTLVARR